MTLNYRELDCQYEVQQAPADGFEAWRLSREVLKYIFKGPEGVCFLTLPSFLVATDTSEWNGRVTDRKEHEENVSSPGNSPP